MKKQIAVILFLFIIFASCKKSNTENTTHSSGNNISDSTKFKIEFVELGSVNCIPCKKMQPVMKNIETKYKGLVKVTFHDVWKDTKKSEEYGIDLIPTQVFKDANGKEIFRHQGFFAEEEIDKFLQSQGVNIPQ
jgi:thioredoxin 1